MFHEDVFDIIVLGGQSNAEGFGIGDVAEDYVPDERILFLNDKSNPRFEKDENGKDVFKVEFPSETFFKIAEETVNEKDGKVGKLALIFAKNYIEKGLLEDGRKILIVNAAVGGTGFARNEWGKAGVLYERLKSLTKEALELNPQNRLVAFLWHQGECDAFENADWSFGKRYITHKENLSVMLNDFCSTFDCRDLPMITAGFCDEWYLKNKYPCDAVLRAIFEVMNLPTRRFISTTGLESNNQRTGNGDDIHFCRESLYILGRRFFDAYLDIRK